MSEIAIRVVAAVMASANVAVVILILLWERPGRACGSNPLAASPDPAVNRGRLEPQRPRPVPHRLARKRPATLSLTVVPAVPRIPLMDYEAGEWSFTRRHPLRSGWRRGLVAFRCDARPCADKSVAHGVGWWFP